MSDYEQFLFWKVGILSVLAVVYGIYQGIRDVIDRKRLPEQFDKGTEANSDS